MLKSGQIALAGKVKGLWNKDTRSFEVKRGVSSTGNKYQIFEISVSSKNQDGSYTNGKGVKVMLSGETKVEHNSIVGVMGFLYRDWETDISDRKSTRLNSSHSGESRMPSSA